jgi:predicted alpha/beta superfamily hydrolase
MKVEAYKTTLTPFDTDVTFRVMVPDGYEVGDRHYPVLYMHDGQDIFYDDDAINGHSLQYAQYYKSFNRFLPQIIIVGIDCPMNNAKRTQQYTPYSKHFDIPEGVNFEADIHGTGKEYLDWIVSELKPWIDANYRTRPQREYTALGGFSTGGVISTYGVLKYPSTFSRLLVMSGAFYIWMDCLDKTMDCCNLDHVKYIYLDAGTNERGRMTTPEQFLEGAKIMNDRFASFGFDEEQLYFKVFHDDLGHSQQAWKRRFPDAVRWIFQDL